MSTRPRDRRAAARAEARRRSRLAARGEPLEADDEADEAAPEQPAREGFLRRLFPPAPPLAGRPDPLAGFNREAPLRPLREGLFMLRKAPLVWLVGGLVCFVGYFLQPLRDNPWFSVLGTMLTFGAIIGAGWFGWRRPWLYGAVTAAIGYGVWLTTILGWFAGQGISPVEVATPLQLAATAAVQLGLGVLGGWYGGYLRRRQAQLSEETRRLRAQRSRRR